MILPLTLSKNFNSSAKSSTMTCFLGKLSLKEKPPPLNPGTSASTGPKDTTFWPNINRSSSAALKWSIHQIKTEKYKFANRPFLSTSSGTFRTFTFGRSAQMTSKWGFFTAAKSSKMWVRITCMKFAVSSWKKRTWKTSFITTLRTTIPARRRTGHTCFWPCAKTASQTQTNKNPSSKLSFLKFYRNKICLRTKISLKHWTITWTNLTSSESKTNHNKVFPAALFWMSWSTVKENQLETVMPLSPQLSLNLSFWKILHTWKKYFTIHKRTCCGLTTGQSLCTGSNSLKLAILKISRSKTFRLLKVSKGSGTGKPNQIWRV